jgi:hypothetical protein
LKIRPKTAEKTAEKFTKNGRKVPKIGQKRPKICRKLNGRKPAENWAKKRPKNCLKTAKNWRKTGYKLLNKNWQKA